MHRETCYSEASGDVVLGQHRVLARRNESRPGAVQRFIRVEAEAGEQRQPQACSERNDAH